MWGSPYVCLNSATVWGHFFLWKRSMAGVLGFLVDFGFSGLIYIALCADATINEGYWK